MDSLKIGFLQNDGTGGHQTAQDVRTHSPNPDDEVIRQINPVKSGPPRYSEVFF